jgi:hypothetical protein
MAVLSVDLACRSWSDLGVVVLEQKGPLITCDIIRWQDAFPPPVVELALRLNTLCLERSVGVLMLDGPQAWDSAHPPENASARDDRGAGGVPLSGSYERFAGYCLALYEALARLGWQRLSGREPFKSGTSDGSGAPRKILVESYPQAAWKSLGIAPLPPKRECRVSDLAVAYSALTALLPIKTSQPPNHDQLQAIAGGLPGLAIEERFALDVQNSGHSIRRHTEWWEGSGPVPIPPPSRKRKTPGAQQPGLPHG